MPLPGKWNMMLRQCALRLFSRRGGGFLRLPVMRGVRSDAKRLSAEQLSPCSSQKPLVKSAKNPTLSELRMRKSRLSSR